MVSVDALARPCAPLVPASTGGSAGVARALLVTLGGSFGLLDQPRGQPLALGPRLCLGLALFLRLAVLAARPRLNDAFTVGAWTFCCFRWGC